MASLSGNCFTFSLVHQCIARVTVLQSRGLDDDSIGCNDSIDESPLFLRFVKFSKTYKFCKHNTPKTMGIVYVHTLNTPEINLSVALSEGSTYLYHGRRVFSCSALDSFTFSLVHQCIAGVTVLQSSGLDDDSMSCNDSVDESPFSMRFVNFSQTYKSCKHIGDTLIAPEITLSVARSEDKPYTSHGRRVSSCSALDISCALFLLTSNWISNHYNIHVVCIAHAHTYCPSLPQ